MKKGEIMISSEKIVLDDITIELKNIRLSDDSVFIVDLVATTVTDQVVEENVYTDDLLKLCQLDNPLISYMIKD